MALFTKGKYEAQAGAADKPIGFTKQKRFLFLKVRSKPVYAGGAQSTQTTERAASKPTGIATNVKKPSRFHIYIAKIIERHKGLDIALKDQGIRSSPYDFVKKMVINSLIVSTVISIVVFILLFHIGIAIAADILIAIALEYAFYTVFLNNFVNFPIAKGKNVGKAIERDILFAARDIVISMRSGMPLYNAMVTVTSGYGAASKEFGKVVELIQLGMPIEQAIEEVSEKSESRTFKRIMLQASASIKAGADVIDALQDTISDVTQERVTELRRYGQRLNALAMFYMLFGVIFPSMGMAVGIILTTFISLFSINSTMLVAVLVGILFLQLIFLNIMRSSRPTFAM